MKSRVARNRLTRKLRLQFSPVVSVVVLNLLQVKKAVLLPLGSPEDVFQRCPKGPPKAQEVQCWAAPGTGQRCLGPFYAKSESMPHGESLSKVPSGAGSPGSGVHPAGPPSPSGPEFQGLVHWASRYMLTSCPDEGLKDAVIATADVRCTFPSCLSLSSKLCRQSYYMGRSSS